MPSYAPSKPVTTPRRTKVNKTPAPLEAHWHERTAYLTETLVRMRGMHPDATWHRHIDRALAHVFLLRNVTRNREYARVYRLVNAEVAYALRLSRPKQSKS